ncbi:hypothetical protein [Rhizobium sp. SSA_523]|nr:hypothetical protein [Rhizobium sp. SSA_523]WKC25937.1 hypothetical protein QTJ18_12300 [Rhizobium sp. SSA_523]
MSENQEQAQKSKNRGKAAYGRLRAEFGKTAKTTIIHIIAHL